MFQRKGNGALARAAQPGEPKGGASLFEQATSFFTSHVSFMPGDIRRFNFAHENKPEIREKLQKLELREGDLQVNMGSRKIQQKETEKTEEGFLRSLCFLLFVFS